MQKWKKIIRFGKKLWSYKPFLYRVPSPFAALFNIDEVLGNFLGLFLLRGDVWSDLFVQGLVWFFHYFLEVLGDFQNCFDLASFMIGVPSTLFNFQKYKILKNEDQ